jgi:hypothetical protein
MWARSSRSFGWQIPWLLDSFPLQPFGYMARVLPSIALVLSIEYIVFGKSIVTDESGSASTSVVWASGYIFWIGCILVASIRAFLPRLKIE